MNSANQTKVAIEGLKDGIHGYIKNSYLVDRLYFYPDIGDFCLSLKIEYISDKEGEKNEI